MEQLTTVTTRLHLGRRFPKSLGSVPTKTHKYLWSSCVQRPYFPHLWVCQRLNTLNFAITRWKRDSVLWFLVTTLHFCSKVSLHALENQNVHWIRIESASPPCSTVYSLRALWQSANFTCSLLLIVLCNMAGYLSDFDDVDDDFEYDGRPYRSEWAVVQRRASTTSSQ